MRMASRRFKPSLITPPGTGIRQSGRCVHISYYTRNNDAGEAGSVPTLVRYETALICNRSSVLPEHFTLPAGYTARKSPLSEVHCDVADGRPTEASTAIPPDCRDIVTPSSGTIGDREPLAYDEQQDKVLAHDNVVYRAGLIGREPTR